MCVDQPAELDAVKSSPASMETLWKLVEIPFMHQARCVLRFIKKLPGNYLLELTAQGSVIFICSLLLDPHAAAVSTSC